MAGCSAQSRDDDGPPPDAEVIVAPEGEWRFEPAELTVGVGEAVTWYFTEPGHNVSCRPGHSQEAAVPGGAAPFSTYAASASPQKTASSGSTFTHTFETPGAYTYVCIPHVSYGMIGEIHVSG